MARTARRCVSMQRQANVLMVTHACELTTALSRFITLKSTRQSSAIATLIVWRTVTLEICAPLLTARTNFQLICCTRWSKMLTFICSISKLCGVRLTTRCAVTCEMSVSMPTTGRISDASLTCMNTHRRSSATSGPRRRRPKPTVMAVTWSTGVLTAMAGKKRSIIQATSGLASVTVKTAARKDIAHIIILRPKSAHLLCT